MATGIARNWRLLIVDDDRNVLESLRRTLRQSDLDLTLVSNPQEAIELIRRETFDLLLSDIDMPEISGHEVMKHAHLLQPSMIRVFVTGAGKMETAVRAINEGEVHRFVRKPFDTEGLRQLVREALDQKAELDLVSEASWRTRQRRLLYKQLEVEHPGITRVKLDDKGVLVVNTDSIEQVAKTVGLMSLVE